MSQRANKQRNKPIMVWVGKLSNGEICFNSLRDERGWTEYYLDYHWPRWKEKGVRIVSMKLTGGKRETKK